nr:hypothetical protein [Melittangium boletus]
MQVALAWLLRRAPNILLIPDTFSVAHLRENSWPLPLSPRSPPPLLLGGPEMAAVRCLERRRSGSS